MSKLFPWLGHGIFSIDRVASQYFRFGMLYSHWNHNQAEKGYVIFSIEACINLFDWAYRIAVESITRQEENNQAKKRTKNIPPHKIIKNPHNLIQYPILTIYYILIQFPILSIFDNPTEGKCSSFFNEMSLCLSFWKALNSLVPLKECGSVDTRTLSHLYDLARESKLPHDCATFNVFLCAFHPHLLCNSFYTSSQAILSFHIEIRAQDLAILR